MYILKLQIMNILMACYVFSLPNHCELIADSNDLPLKIPSGSGTVLCRDSCDPLQPIP